MLRIIRKLLTGDSSKRPAATASKSLPAPGADLINRAFVAVYTDGRGADTERQLVCKSVYRSGDRVYMDAVCADRRALRTFRVDRILELYCGQTGEDLGDPSSVLLPWGAERPVRFPPVKGAKEAPIKASAPPLAKPDLCFREPVRLVVDVGADGEVTEVVGTLVEYSYEQRPYGVRSYLSLRPDAPFKGSRRIIKMDMVPEVTGYDMKVAVNLTCCESRQLIHDFYEWIAAQSNALK